MFTNIQVLTVVGNNGMPNLFVITGNDKNGKKLQTNITQRDVFDMCGADAGLLTVDEVARRALQRAAEKRVLRSVNVPTNPSR